MVTCSSGRIVSFRLAYTVQTSFERSLRRKIPLATDRNRRSVSKSPSTAFETSAGHDGPSRQYPHVPVLTGEVLQAFSNRNLRIFVDGTLGAGGHTSQLLAAHPELVHILGIDLDPSAHNIASDRLEAEKKKLASLCNLHLIRNNFSQINTCCEQAFGCESVDGILLDLGVSSMQINTADRGFSFSLDGRLDMRMSQNIGISAEQIVNTWSEGQLTKIFRDYGEERFARSLAAKIVDQRVKAPIHTTHDLLQAIGHRTNLAQKPRGARIHPATRIFQALRIAVNEELRHLEAAIPQCIARLAPGGRLAVISFHSLEDRIVKHLFLRAAGKPTDLYAPQDGTLEAEEALGSVVTKKPIVPTADEQGRNPRSRSAKLRIFERKIS